MKKRLWILFAAGILCLTGCQSKEEKQKEAIMEAFEEMGVEHNEVIMSVLSKEWQVIGQDDTYEFTKEGTGTLSGEAFSYSCGFNEENEIMLQITMDDEEELNYFVSSDETGLGLYLEEPTTEEMQHLIPSDVELLDVAEEVPQFLGEWADKSDNRYILKEDMTMTIKSADSEKEGTYSVACRENENILTLVFGNGSSTLEFVYEFVDDTTVRLCAPGTDTVHTWVKK